MNKEPKNLRSYHGSHFNLQGGHWKLADSQLFSKEGSQIRRASQILDQFKNEQQISNEVKFVHENR